ncbi:hypothetical protein Slin15195_G058360 [Septoria linicola]|uniref:Uncharacterized protein n=1 Tax=Septoria linicola TaxID=215465 RepID=A0A9Q9EJT2_9PEZI|nr:hypothetical protein Slin15195_G058360 [Septoria linicola]
MTNRQRAATTLDWNITLFPFKFAKPKVPQSDCAAALAVRDEKPTPDCIGYLSDLRELRMARGRCGGELNLNDPDAALKIGIETLDALTDQLVAIRICVDTMHRQFSDMLDEQVDIAEGGEYRLAMNPEDGVEKHELLRKWVLSLPHVREWFGDGSVQSEAEALLLTACAAGQPRLGLGDDKVRLCDDLDEGHVRLRKLQVEHEVSRSEK